MTVPSLDGSDADVTSFLVDIGALETRLEEDETIAVIGEPFAGRDRVLDHVEKGLEADRISLDPDCAPETVTDALGSGPVVVDNCQHLYSRRIGGFDGLDTVLTAIARTDEPVVTGWNSYAWSYLAAVRDIETDFETVELDTLSGADLGEILRSTEPSLPSFQIKTEEEPLFRYTSVSLGWRDQRLKLPTIDRSAVRTRLDPPDEPETAVFDRLASLAGGNLGVALTLWAQRPDEAVVAPSDFEVPTVQLDREAAFLLRIVLAQETVAQATLRDRSDGRIDRLLAALRSDGIVRAENDSLSLAPEGVPAAIDATERQRIL